MSTALDAERPRDPGAVHEFLLGSPSTCSERYACPPDEYYISIEGELGEHVLRYPYDAVMECISEPYIAPWYSERKGQMTATAACAGPGDTPPCILIVSVPEGLDAVELLGNCGGAWRLDRGTATSGTLEHNLEDLAEARLDVTLVDRATGEPSNVEIAVRVCRWLYDR
jgi:hypothetical protein